MSEEVNRKCPPRNTVVQLSTPYINPGCHNAQCYRQMTLLYYVLLRFAVHQQSTVLAVIDSICLSVGLSVHHTLALCQNDYDHVVLTGG